VIFTFFPVSLVSQRNAASIKPLEGERSIREMRVTRISLRFAAFAMLFLSIACASTKFPSIWKDDTYQGHPGRFLVISTFPNGNTRRLFEDELVKALKERRMEAIVSYTVMPDPVAFNMDALAAQAKVAGADTVLINSPVAAGMDETGGYKYIKTQTDVYDMKSERLVFSASAEMLVREGEPYVPQIQSYVKDVVNKLSR
jgi:hypothetical protein